MTQLSLFDEPPPRPTTLPPKAPPRPTTLPGKPPRPNRGRAPIVIPDGMAWDFCKKALAEGTGGQLPLREDQFGVGHKVTCVAYDGTIGVVEERFPSGIIQVGFGRTHLLYWPDGVLHGRYASNEDHNLSHL